MNPIIRKIAIFSLLCAPASLSFGIDSTLLRALKATLHSACNTPLPTPTEHNLNITTIRSLGPWPESCEKTPVLTPKKIILSIRSESLPETAYVPIRKKGSKNKRILQVQSGVHLNKHDNVVFLIAPGIAHPKVINASKHALYNPEKTLFDCRGGFGFATTYTKMRDSSIGLMGPCITFDFHDRYGTTDIGGPLDVACLNTVYHLIRTQRPDIKIVLVGDSRGARAALNFLQTKNPVIDRIMLFAPFADVKPLSQALSQRLMPYTPDVIRNHISNAVHKIVYPYFKSEDDTLLTQLKKKPPTPPG